MSELDEEYLTPAECGTKLNLQVATVRRLIKDGVLLPNKLGRGWQIPANVLDAFITGGLQLDVSHKQAQNQRRRKSPANERCNAIAQRGVRNAQEPVYVRILST